MTRFLLIFCLIFGFVPPGRSFPDPGRFSLTLNDSQQYNAFVKNVYNGTKIFVKIRCEPKSDSGQSWSPWSRIILGWLHGFSHRSEVQEIVCFVLLQIPKCFGLVQIFCSRPMIYLDIVAVTKIMCQTNFKASSKNLDQHKTFLDL